MINEKGRLVAGGMKEGIEPFTEINKKLLDYG
jgi:hypothetical protein